MADNTSLDALNESFAIPGVLAFDEPHPGMKRLRVSSPACTAELYLHGAHLAHWQPADHEPVLYLSPNYFFSREKAIRGGVPVIFPWFGARTVEITGGRTGGAQHGFARTAEWTLAFAAQMGEDVYLNLVLGPEEAAKSAGFEHFRASMEFRLGRTLTMRMTVANDGNGPLTFEQALHSYFHIGDAREAKVLGLEGTEYLDKTEGFARRLQQDPVVQFAGEVDRPYLNTKATVRLEDPVLKRRIVVAKAGSETTVVWNPWSELAAQLPDLGAGEWQHFVCIETANAQENRITLPPQAAHVMEAHVSLEPLA